MFTLHMQPTQRCHPPIGCNSCLTPAWLPILFQVPAVRGDAAGYGDDWRTLVLQVGAGAWLHAWLLSSVSTLRLQAGLLTAGLPCPPQPSCGENRPTIIFSVPSSATPGPRLLG